MKVALTLSALTFLLVLLKNCSLRQGFDWKNESQIIIYDLRDEMFIAANNTLHFSKKIIDILFEIDYATCDNIPNENFKPFIVSIYKVIFNYCNLYLKMKFI